MSKKANKREATRRATRQRRPIEEDLPYAKRDSMRAARRNYGGGEAPDVSHLHPIFKDTAVDPHSENFIPCRRDGYVCDCIASCKRWETAK